MNTTTLKIKKIYKLKDKYVMVSIINIISMVIISDLVYSSIGWWFLLAMTPLYIYFFTTSIAVSLSRCWLIDRLNNLLKILDRVSNQITLTEQLINLKDRKIYRRRIVLLKKYYKIYTEVFEQIQKALNHLQNMNIKTIIEIEDMLKIADNIAKTKVFLEKNEK